MKIGYSSPYGNGKNFNLCMQIIEKAIKDNALKIELFDITRQEEFFSDGFSAGVQWAIDKLKSCWDKKEVNFYNEFYYHTADRLKIEWEKEKNGRK